ncbi:MAG: HEAT repeat domain-containing protein [Candidatus Omnitrophota bacterium]
MKVIICICGLLLFTAFRAGCEDSDPAIDTYSKILVSSTVVEALGKLGDASVRDVLIKALESDQFFIRVSAIKALGAIKDKGSIFLLKEQLADKNYLVRIAAAVALIDLGDKDAEKLLFLFLKDQDSAVRASTVNQVGRLGEHFLVILHEMLLKETDDLVRISLIEQLGGNGYKPALSYVRQALNDKNAKIRRAACTAIGSFDDRESIPQLFERLDDESNAVRATATMVLSQFGEALEIKIPSLYPEEKQAEETDSLLIAAFYIAAANLGKLEFLPVLLEEIIAPGNPMIIRKEAARALAILKPHISRIIKDAVGEAEKLHDISLLGNLQFEYQVNGKSLVLIFINAIKDKQSPLYQDAPLVLNELKDERALPALREALLQDDDPDMVAAAAYALGALGDKNAIRYLIEVFKKYGI